MARRWVRAAWLLSMAALVWADGAWAQAITNQLQLPRKVYLETSAQGEVINFEVAFEVAAQCRPLVALFRYLDAEGELMLARRLVNHTYNDIERYLTILDAQGNALPLTSVLEPGQVVTLTHPYSELDWPGQAPASVEVDLYLASAAGVESFSWQVPVLTHRQRARLRLPFAGVWWHFEGHDAFSHHRHLPVTMNSNYFACDFMIADDNLAIARGQGLSLEDYYCFGEPIHAAGAGQVAAVVSGLPDNPPGELDPFYEDQANAGQYAGNLVIIDHGAGEYTYYAHLKQGSVRVSPGQEVLSGQIIGMCGNSGSSTSAPHLHFQMMAAPELDFTKTQGLPAVFAEFELKQGAGWLKVRDRSLLAGELVRPPSD